MSVVHNKRPLVTRSAASHRDPLLSEPRLRRFTLGIDHHNSLEEYISLGAYDWVHCGIGKALEPAPPQAPVGVQSKCAALFHFDVLMTTEHAKYEMSQRGFRSATLRELLAFGRAFPLEQQEIPIVALDSVMVLRRDEHVAYLFGIGPRRGLGLVWLEGAWDAAHRFLAIKK